MKRLGLALGILVLLTVFAYSYKISIMDATQPIHVDPSPPVSDVRLGEQFVSRHDNLHRVDVRFATPSRFHRGKVILRLRNSRGDSHNLRVAAVDAVTVKDNKYSSFVFSPISDSKNRSYIFYLSTKDLGPEDVFVWWADTTKDRNGFVNSTRLNGDLVFDAYYQTSLLEGAWVVLGRISSKKPLSFGSPVFLGGMFAAYAVAALLLVFESIAGAGKR